MAASDWLFSPYVIMWFINSFVGPEKDRFRIVVVLYRYKFFDMTWPVHGRPHLII